VLNNFKKRNKKRNIEKKKHLAQEKGLLKKYYLNNKSRLQRVGIEPTKQDCKGFTVLPLWPLGHLKQTKGT
jgi:hypothetical protein